MPKYTVKDKESGKTITFNWNGNKPPSDSDMEEIFAASKDFSPKKEIVNKPSEFIGSMASELPEKPPYSMKDTEPYIRPVLEYGTMTVGGAIGSGVGPGGTIAGAGLGYGIGKKSADIIYGRKQGTIGKELLGSAVDVSQGASMEMGGAIIGKLTTLIGERPAAEKLYNTIRRGVEKAIRPGVALQRTAGQAKQYYKRATDAVTNIVINKNNLRLTDESGKVIDGLPKTLKQFSEAIGQTKKIIFQQYDELAKTATGQGAKVELDSISNELLAMLNNKPFVDMAPNAAKYASDRAASLLERGSYTPAEAQEAIQILNKSLEAFYKSPSYETATIAAVDSLIANNLRKNLDDTIVSLTGETYQGLKNTYGALTHIERDVARRAAVDARKNIKGLIDFSDIFSGAEVIHGIVSMNPGFIAKGIMAKSIASYYRYINNPNRIVKAMFSEVENILTKRAIAANRSIASSGMGRSLGRSVAYGTLYENRQ